jgi:hypothetical protein
MKDTDGNIGIGEWAEGVIAEICRFADHWNKKRAAGDEAYPERMGRGDWDEQFEFYTANRSHCSADHPDDAQCQPCDWNWRHFPDGRVGWCYKFAHRVGDCAQRRCVYTTLND